MEDKYFLAPAEIADATLATAEGKSKLSIPAMAILGFMAGTFIAFAAEGSNMAAYNLWENPATYGLGKLVAGLLFVGGLAMCVTAGAELFTGNVLMLNGVMSGRISVVAMLRNWSVVYVANFIGSVFIAFLMVQSGLLHTTASLLGVTTIKIAAGKATLTFEEAFVRGILCNWLVCIAVWVSFAAKSITCKVAGILFPIWIFVTTGFEHCVANMYYVPAGILAKVDPVIAKAALAGGMTQVALDDLTWGAFFMNNLLPVTLGNLVGGAIFVGMGYWFVFSKGKKA